MTASKWLQHLLQATQNCSVLWPYCRPTGILLCIYVCICPAPRRAIAVAPCTCTLQSPAHSMVQIYRCMPHCFPPSATAVFHFFFELQQRFLHPAIVNRLPYWTRTCPSRHAKVSTTSCTHQCIPTNMSSQNMIRDSPSHQDFVKHSC